MLVALLYALCWCLHVLSLKFSVFKEINTSEIFALLELRSEVLCENPKVFECCSIRAKLLRMDYFLKKG